MVGVALSRVRGISDLQVLDFSRDVCQRPPEAVSAFLAERGLAANIDPSECCRGIPFVDPYADDLANLVSCFLSQLSDLVDRSSASFNSGILKQWSSPCCGLINIKIYKIKCNVNNILREMERSV